MSPRVDDLGFVHRYIAPRGSSSRTLLLLHGTGGNENDLVPLGEALDPEAGLLSPRGKVLERGMPRFFRRLAEGVFDEADLRFRTQELATFVAGAATTYGFDPASVVAVGYSNGANIAASLLLLSPKTLAGAALLHAMVPLQPEEAPNLAEKRVLLTAGENDPMVPPEQAMRLHKMLVRYGAEVRMAWFTEGHGLSAEEVEMATAWMGG